MARVVVAAVCALLLGAAEPRTEPLLGKLSVTELRWLNLVDSLITEEELAAFLALPHAYQRKAFIAGFWRARDPFPETGVNEFYEHWRWRTEVADERYGGVITDRGRIYLLAGAATFIHRNICPELLPTNEVWVYRGEDSYDVSVVFRLAPGGSGFQLWDPASGIAELVPWSRTRSLAEDELRRQMAETCRRARESIALLTRAVDLETLIEVQGTLPEPSPEWVGTFLARTTEVPAGAAVLPGRLELAFPGRHRSRTVVQGLVVVPTDRATPSGREPSTYEFLVDGDILRGEELFESFHYRFDLPLDDLGGAEIPLLIRRHLRPGRYELILRVQDLNGGGFFRTQETLEVPRLAASVPGAASPPPGVAESAAPEPQRPVPEPRPRPAPRDRPGAAVTELEPEAPEDEQIIEILPLPEHLTTGRQRVDARVSSERVARVAFVLNGDRIMTKRRPPFSLELDFGETPRTHVLEAVAFDSSGVELARDRREVNAGPQRLSVRLLEPRAGRSYVDQVQVRAEVDLPPGQHLERVELYLNESRLATLYQSPFVQALSLPPGGRINYVRAVAVLEDGNSAEDLVFINAPGSLDELQVDLVELYTSVRDRRGTNIEGLEQSEFQVVENGVEQRIVRFERAVDLPIHVAFVIDASLSMGEEMESAERAALGFIERVIERKDRAAVIVFSDRPELRVALTNDHARLAGGLSGVVAQGETALYDSVVFGLHYVAGLRGKRALILLSDGEDSISRYGFDEALEYARHSGTAIYAIGLGLSKHDKRSQILLGQLASATGGSAYFVDEARDLAEVYGRIEAELRTQYLIVYQSSLADEGFREVEVRMARRELVAKTIPGYFP